MDRRHVGIVVGCALALLGAWWLVSRTSEPSVEPVSTASDASTERSTANAELQAPARADARAVDTTETTSAGVAEDNVLHLMGRVHVVNARGEHVPSERGSVEWDVIEAGAHAKRTSKVADDLWTLDVASSAVVHATKVVWENARGETRFTRIDEPTLEASDAFGHVIEATLVDGVRLNVVDARTGLHLDDVELVATHAADCKDRDTPYPPACWRDTPHEAHLHSPIDLPLVRGTRIGWVGAPKHAWTRFGFAGSEGELTVTLADGADVDVIVENVPEDAKEPTLRVYADRAGRALDAGSTEPIVERAVVAREALRLDGLRTGRTTFVVVPDRAANAVGPFLARVEVELEAGSATVVRIDLASLATKAAMGSIRAEVAPETRGTALPSDAWLLVELRGSGRTSVIGRTLPNDRVDARGNVVELVTGLIPGEYVASLFPSGGARALTVRAGEVADVAFSFADRRDVTVTVLDAATKQRTTDASVAFRPAECEATAWSPPATFDRAAGVHRFRSVPGRVKVQAQAPGRRTRVEELDVDRAENALTIELELEPKPRAKLAVTVRARQGETDVPLPRSYWAAARVTPVAPCVGRCTSVQTIATEADDLSSNDAWSADYLVSEPGTYRIEFPTRVGLRPWPATEVTVDGPPGATKTFEVVFE